MLKSKFAVHVQYRPFRWLGAIFFAATVLGAGNILATAAASDAKAVEADRTITVQGVVFNDTNGDGVQDANEKGIANVIVSDGLQVTQTDRTGHYTLAGVKLKDSRSVFVVTPSGFRNVGPFYQNLSTAPNFGGINFPLAADPERVKPNFSFGQITDLHVTDMASSGRLVESLKQAAKYKPVFVVATGDLVNQGDVAAQFLSYETAVRQSPLPIVSGIGNHDLLDAPRLGPHQFHRLVCADVLRLRLRRPAFSAARFHGRRRSSARVAKEGIGPSAPR